MEDDILEIDCIVTTKDSESRSYSKKDYATDNCTTQNEYARALSARAKMIENGAPLMIDWDEPFDPVSIAQKELELGLAPLYIERVIPDKHHPNNFRIEKKNIKDMDLRDV